jgi:hypothetical protein
MSDLPPLSHPLQQKPLQQILQLQLRLLPLTQDRSMIFGAKSVSLNATG